jgi:hypothetical protein
MGYRKYNKIRAQCDNIMDLVVVLDASSGIVTAKFECAKIALEGMVSWSNSGF